MMSRATLDASQADWLNWILRVWLFVTCSTVLTGLGLRAALRGAWLGLDAYLPATDLVVDLLAQGAATGTALLLVHLGVVQLRFARPLLPALVSSVLALAPALFLLSAQKVELPQQISRVGALAAGGSMVLAGLLQARSLNADDWDQSADRRTLRIVLLLIGSATLAQAVATQTEVRSELALALAAIHWGFGVAALVTLVVRWLWSHAHLRHTLGALRLLPLVFTVVVPVLLMASVNASRTAEASRLTVLVGRTLSALLPPAPRLVSEALASFQLSFALAALCVLGLVERQRLSLQLAALLTLLTQLPHTPLTSAALTLCGLAWLVCGRSPAWTTTR